jgi:hypothetical protein
MSLFSREESEQSVRNGVPNALACEVGAHRFACSIQAKDNNRKFLFSE